MWVRIQEFSFAPEHAQQVIAEIRNRAATLHYGEGYRGFRLLVDLPNSRALDVSYWDCEQAVCERDAIGAATQELPLVTALRINRYELAIDAA
jgi:hypothetical protein